MSDIIIANKEDLVSVADSIRTLCGSSDLMSVGGMKTNIDGANTAVEDAFAALTEKGVTVPDGTKVDGLAALIAAIEAGGGGGKITRGTFTVEADTQTNNLPDINHGLGEVPDVFIVYVEAYDSFSSGDFVACLFYTNSNDNTKYICFPIMANGSSSSYGSTEFINTKLATYGRTSANKTTYANAEYLLLIPGGYMTTYFRAGETYSWIAAGA